MGTDAVGWAWFVIVGLVVWFGFVTLKATFTRRAPDARRPTRAVADQRSSAQHPRRLLDGHRPWTDPKDRRSAAVQDRFIRGQIDEATFVSQVQQARHGAA